MGFFLLVVISTVIYSTIVRPVHCTEKIMDRGEKIESLKDQTSTMVEASYDFHLASRETRSR